MFFPCYFNPYFLSTRVFDSRGDDSKIRCDEKMNRKCKRCGIILNSDLMHYNKQQGWLCNNRKDCTQRIYKNEA